MIRRTVTFYFEGRPLRGVEGEPVARALFAAGIRTLSYSVKYKRPRGVHCARGRCVACHMSVDGVPGVPTCITPLRPGMQVERENYPPFYGPLAAFLARWMPLPTGFYYRMLTRPAFLRKSFLWSLRRLAGVGRLAPVDAARSSASPPVSAGPEFESGSAERGPAREAPERGTERGPAERRSPPHATPPVGDTYDVVVVGSGLSGMAAALSAAHHGMNVLLVDEYGVPGGHSFGYQPDGDLASARGELVEGVGRHTSIQYRPGVTAQGFYPPNTLLLGPGGSIAVESPAGPAGVGDETSGVLPRAGMTRVSARAFVFATGANDLIPLFDNADLPGIFGERAIRLLLERDEFRPGRRAVVYGTGTPLRVTAQLLLHHDIKLVALVDPTAEAKSDPHGRRVLDKIRTVTEMKVTAARGGEWIEAVEVSRGGGKGRTVIECDLLCVALPGQPAYELAYQAGFEFALADSPLEERRVMLPVTVRRVSEDPTVSFFVTGEAAGERDWKTKIEKGRQAGAEAAETVRA